MEINREDIKHLADLSNFSVSGEEAKSLEKDLQSILNYVSELNSLNTDGVEPTFQVFEMENVWRSDEVEPAEADREALLSLTKESENHQIKVPKVL